MLLDSLSILFALFLPPIAGALIDAHYSARKAPSDDNAKADTLASARACLAIIEMTPTNNDTPAFGLHFFEELEEGLSMLGS